MAAEVSEYDVGMDRLAQKQDAIRRAYYLPMLELWSGHRGSMTATEVMAREQARRMMFPHQYAVYE